MQPAALRVEKGSPYPLGATPDAGGVNFSLFSENATGVELLLFERDDDPLPFQTFQFDPYVNKTFHFWHIGVRGLTAGAHYAYRVDGPFDLGAGHRFNRNKVLIDPFARGNTDTLWKRADACGPANNVATSMRSVVVDAGGYNWEGDAPLNRPMEDTIIYEVHASGFTQSPSSRVAHPGTFSGIIEKIPYLKELGITAIELMPVAEFPGSRNWGYDGVLPYAAQDSYGGPHELQKLVDACHAAGLAVNTWTVNAPQDVARMVVLGVDVVITDFVDQALAIARA